MPQFLITGPDGKKYKVTGPNAEGALQALKEQIGSAATPVPTPDPSLGADAEISGMLPEAKVNKSGREFEALPSWAKPLVELNDLVGLAANGMTFGFGDKAIAKVDELVGRGTYDEQLAKRRGETAASRERAGIRGAVAEIGGSVIPAVKAAQVGLTATRLPGLWGRLGGMAVDGAAVGGLSAAGNDSDIGLGAGVGAALGAGGQAVAKVGGALAKPFTSRFFPQKATQEVLTKAMDEAGTNPQAIARDLAKARADGQDVYSVMDAMGYPGQRLARNVTRTPSEGRTPMVEFLNKRQAEQGRRVSTALSEGFGDPATALKRTEALKQSRKAGGDVNYTAARNSASSVNTDNVIAKIDSIAGKPVFGGRVLNTPGMADDTIQGLMTRVRSMLVGRDGRAQKIDFNALLTVRQDIGDMASAAYRTGKNNQYSKLKEVLDELDASLAGASKDYKKALTQYADDSRVIDAVDEGRAAAMGGRFEDNIPAFQKKNPSQQAAFRAGYADPLIAQTQQAAVGVNKARPLITDAFGQEFPAFAAPGQANRLGQRVAREQTMFETREQALGGSRTDMNLGDEADMGLLDPSVLGNMLSGNLTGAAKNAILQGISALQGQPASVRKMLSDALRVTDPAIALQNLNAAVAQINASQQQKQAIVRTMMLLGTVGTVQAQP
jgi:hypothetical protein